MDPRETAGVVSAGAGGVLAGRAVADSDLLNALLVRILSNRKGRVRAALARLLGGGGFDYRVPVIAASDYMHQHGSGEAAMGARIARMLRRNGIGSYYVNTQWNQTGKPSEWNAPNANGEKWWNPTVERNGEIWSVRATIDHNNLNRLVGIATDVGGEPSNAKDLIVGRIARAANIAPAKAEAILRSGKFDGYTVGELFDTFNIIRDNGVKDVVRGKMELMPVQQFRRVFESGRLPYHYSTESGMNYSSLDWHAPDRIGANTHPHAFAPNTRSLAADTRFLANYNNPDDLLIPGSEMYDPGVFRRSAFMRRRQYAKDRKVLDKVVRALAAKNGIDLSSIGKNTKYMMISTGNAGANAAEKLRLAEKAFGNDPNVRIILQYGNGSPKPGSAGVDLYTNNGIMEEIRRINTKRPGFVLHAPKIDKYPIVTRAVDLHGTYGGSSTISTSMSQTNPQITLTDTILNRGNNNYATSRAGIRQVDTLSTALRHLAANPATDRNTVVNGRDGLGRTLGEIERIMGIGPKTDFDRLEREGVKALQDAMYRSGGQFSKANVARANSMIKEMRGRNKDVIRGVVNQIRHAIERNDASAFRNSKGIGRAARGVARTLFRTAAGRRLGIPLALAGGATGVLSALKAFQAKNKDN